MKNNYFLRWTRKLLCTLILLLGIFVNAQSVAITYPSPSQQITACYGSSLLTVRPCITQASATGGDVTINLPTGITYVPSSVIKTAGTALLTITENGETLTVPNFKLAPNSLAVGDFIVFTKKKC